MCAYVYRCPGATPLICQPESCGQHDRVNAAGKDMCWLLKTVRFRKSLVKRCSGCSGDGHSEVKTVEHLCLGNLQHCEGPVRSPYRRSGFGVSSLSSCPSLLLWSCHHPLSQFPLLNLGYLLSLLLFWLNPQTLFCGCLFILEARNLEEDGT